MSPNTGAVVAVKPEVILSKALKAASPEDIERLIESYTRSGCRWLPFAGDTGNKGLIEVQSDPIRALVERITNGFDANIERLIAEGNVDASVLTTPIEAVNQLFPTPKSREHRVAVEIDPERGGFPSCTVTVVDYGTGIAPDAFKTTILSLSRNNKINKRYLIGTYGQGGAASIGMIRKSGTDGYVLIASRTSATAPIGFTIVRYAPPSLNDKRGYFEFLTDVNGEILAVDADGAEATDRIAVPKTFGEFQQGTIVRHFGYDLSGYKNLFYKDQEGPVTAFNTFLFRPLFPVHLNVRVLAGGRRKDKKTGRPTWNNNPLRIYGVGQFLDDHTEAVTSKTPKVEYPSPVSKMPIKINGKAQGHVQLTYSVLSLECKTSPLTHRAKTVVSTFNGQTQDERSLIDISNKFKDEFPYIVGNGRNDLIVEIRVDKLSPVALDELLASTREHFKDAECWQQIRKVVTDQILQDEMLYAINDIRYQRSLDAGKQKESNTAAITYAMDFVKSNFLKGTSFTKGGSRRVRRTPREITPIKLQKIEPTFIRFLADAAHFNIESTSTRRYFMLETDAPNGFRDPVITFLGEGDKYLSVEVVAPAQAGRLRIAVDVAGGKEGMVGVIFAAYPKTKVEIASIPYYFIKQEIKRQPKDDPKGSGGTQMSMPEVKPIAVDSQHPDWVRFADSAISVDPPKDGVVTVYYNVEFPQYVAVMDGLSEAEAKFIESEFVGTITAHVILLADSGTAYQDGEALAKVVNRAAASAFLMSAKKSLEVKQGKK